VYRSGSKNVLADTLSYYEQDTGRQEALEKTYYTQVLLTPDKLNLEITYRLLTKLAPVLKTFINFLKASVILINGYVLLDLINYILIANKQSPSLKDKRAKAIRDNQD
jgi:hypothetical protein